MKIDKERLNRNHWYEDLDGNEISPEEAKEKDCVTYHSQWPLQITEDISAYEWHPETKLQKRLCKIRPIGNYLRKKYFKEKTFKHLCSFNTNIGRSSEEIILKMANSGDYTLGEAIMLWANSCERCMNVLEYKYTNGAGGYPEYSDEWKKCNTVCDFCRDERQNGERYDT